MGGEPDNLCSKVLSGRAAEEEAAVFKKGVEKFCYLKKMGAFGEENSYRNGQDVEEDFYLSKIPMYLTKNEFAGNIMQENSPLYGKVMVTAFPGNHENRIVLGGVSEAFVVNGATQYPQQAVSALEEILRDFSAGLYEYGAGIPVWNVENRPGPDAELYSQIMSLKNSSDDTMQYWEFSLERKKSEDFLQYSQMLFEGEMSPDEFTQKILY